MNQLHTVNIYQRPKQGNNFLRRFNAVGYRHRIISVGGYDTASCEVLTRPGEGEMFIENFLGSRVAVYVDNPLRPIWEGFISRISIDVGATRWMATLENMANRIRITYKRIGATSVDTRNSSFNDDSVAKFGIKTDTIEAGLYGGSASVANNHIDQMKDALLAARNWPTQSKSGSARQGPGTIKIEMLGFYHTLLWEAWHEGGSTERDAGLAVSERITNLDNGTTFFDNTITNKIEANSSFKVSDEHQVTIPVWQQLLKIQEAGDGSVNWVMGVSSSNPANGIRHFYYRPQSTTLRYVERVDNQITIRNEFGGVIKPWFVRPDAILETRDILVSWNLKGDDPRRTYLQKVSYNADNNSIKWSSEDDVTFNGTTQQSHDVNKTNRAFGNTARISEV